VTLTQRVGGAQNIVLSLCIFSNSYCLLIQRCALQIIVGNILYEDMRYMLNFPSLAERRLSMCETLFKQISCESHILQYLLPAKRDTELTCHTRSINKYPTVRARTNRYKKLFVLYALSHF